jgi:ribonuclease R
MVLDYLDRHPDAGSGREIARALRVTGENRAVLRTILSDLAQEGRILRTGARSFEPSDLPPPTAVVVFERLDEEGRLIGRRLGRDGPEGPDLYERTATGRTPGGALAPGARALCRIERSPDGLWSARIVRRIDNAPETSIVGAYRENRYGGVVEPTSRKEKGDYVIEKVDSLSAKDGDLVRVEAKSHRGYGPKRGVVTAILGRLEDPRSASLIALHTHGVPDEFPPDVLREAQNVRPSQTPREDLTGLPLITIDPEDARDHDDAVYAEPDGTGWRVVVAIADVAAYVRTGTALDREAYRRGNSTYFPDRVAPMLPETLSADLCSLKEGELRETFAVEMRFTADGVKTSHRFLRGRMRSLAKLSYREAQDAADGHPSERTAPLVETVIKPLWSAFHALEGARRRREPLELDLPERRVRIGADGTILSIALRERLDAHRLIEEFMIQANVCAAESLDALRSAQIYRVHEEPSGEKLAHLSSFLPTLGVSWAKGQPATGARFNRLLASVEGSEHESLVHETVLRSQAQARYSDENLGHFGLNLAKYAHFTSPIRRYSDLITHRALIRALKLGPDGATEGEAARMEEFAGHVTMTERRSMAAEREASDRYLAIFLSERVGARFNGTVAGVTRAGLFIRLEETGADGLAPAARLGDDYWVYDENTSALVGRRSERRYELGMPVEVRLIEATPLTGSLLFEVLTDPRPPRRDAGRPAAHGRPGPARRRPTDGGGRPPGIRHSSRKPKGSASYGKNKKPKK